MIIAPNLTQHSIVICVDRRERGIGLQTVLSKFGYRVVIALSLYDALKLIAQEMPHLVISEAVLSDGTAGTLYDRLHQHETLRKTPIMVHVLKKTKEELAPLAGRKFAGFFLGQFEPKAFLTKVTEIVTAHAPISPYFVGSDMMGIDPVTTISIEASIVGRSGEQLVSRSGTEVDPAASLICVPTSGDTSPAMLKMATNLRNGDEIFNLFPINRIVGPGRKWVLSLPEFKIGGEARETRVNRVVFYEPNEQRFEGFREVLKGYDIDLIPAKNLGQASAIVKRDFDNLSAVYLHELMNDASGIEWKNVYSKLPPGKRPPVIVGTTSMNARSTSEVRYIKRPFGMGLFIEMLQGSFEKASEVAEVAGKNANNSISGIAVRYQAPATLLGIDETGGILQVRFPLLKGSKLAIGHQFLQAAWDGPTIVQIVGSGVLPSQTDIWHARFESIGAGMSKVKYWEKIAKKLAQMQPPPIKVAS